jgi:hypothetical protein
MVLVEVVLCPSFKSDWELSESQLARGSYVGNELVLGVGIDLGHIMDGESTTIAAGESELDQAWILPGVHSVKTIGAPSAFSSRHGAGAHFLMCDATVRFIADYVDQKTLQALGTPNGRDVAGAF